MVLLNYIFNGSFNRNYIYYMKLVEVINKFEKQFLKKSILALEVGNKIRLGILVKEGEKERVQFFEGILISKNNSSINSTITVRKIFQGIGVERTFPLYSPQIKSISILKNLKAKRAKLFYLRNKIGKAATRIQKK